MKLIPLTQGKVAKIDDEDFAMVNQYKWYYHPTGYAFTNKDKRKIRMHRLVKRITNELEIDHINGDRLDNQKLNLRSCTRKQNSRNKAKAIGTTSIYRGVHWNKKERTWASHICISFKCIRIGTFPKERWAAMAYDIWAKEAFGEFAKLNFNGYH